MGRAASVEQGHHLIADGALKFNESKVNSLSNFSRKAKVKGSRDISVIYAYDLEIQEPICSECFPGNMLDMTAYRRFIQDCVSRKKLLPFTAEYLIFGKKSAQRLENRAMRRFEYMGYTQS